MDEKSNENEIEDDENLLEIRTTIIYFFVNKLEKQIEQLKTKEANLRKRKVTKEVEVSQAINQSQVEFIYGDFAYTNNSNIIEPSTTFIIVKSLMVLIVFFSLHYLWTHYIFNPIFRQEQSIDYDAITSKVIPLRVITNNRYALLAQRTVHTN
jgi:hypothetical protein